MVITSNDTARRVSVLIDQESGQEDVFEAAFAENWDWVCGVLLHLVGDPDEAEDLALEVFYRLHERPPGDWQTLRSWLHRVATNVGLNALRARKRRKYYEETAGKIHLRQSTFLDPAAEVERREEQQLVREVLAHMKPRAAQLLILRHTGLSYAEIAAALNIAPGSVGTMLARAEKKFERLYRKLAPQP